MSFSGLDSRPPVTTGRQDRPTPSALQQVIAAFQGARLLVVGDPLLDSWLDGSTTRICREAPVPILDVARRVDVPGGAGNAAANAVALGAQVRFVGCLGDDAEAGLLRRALAERGVETDNLVVQPGRTTPAKHRLTAEGQLLLRFDQGAPQPLDRVTATTLARRVDELADTVDAVIVSDYGLGSLGEEVRTALGRRPPGRRPVLVVDARQPWRYRDLAPDVVKPNYTEAMDALGAGSDLGAGGEHRATNGDRPGLIAARADELLAATGAHTAVVTLDIDGAVVCERHVPPYRVFASSAAAPGHTTGAGDTFTAALTLSLLAGARGVVAAELASTAAHVAVGEPGTSVCTATELAVEVGGDAKQVHGPAELHALATRQRRAGRRLVFTNGCFDLLHRGHVTYLNRAKALGEVLIVAVNDDDSVRRLKGPERPITGLDDRMAVLAALSCVDYVVAFDGDTPADLLRATRPDVYVKGGDYRPETLPEAPLVEELGGVVRILGYLDDRSTTRLIDRIRVPGWGGVR